jgi:hypothetical protein
MRKLIAAFATTAALAVGVMPAAAQPVVTGGLVNVTIVDAVDVTNNQILNNISITAALALAANVCGVAVNVLAADLKQDGKATCTAGSQVVTLTQQRNRK